MNDYFVTYLFGGKLFTVTVAECNDADEAIEKFAELCLDCDEIFDVEKK